MYKIVLQRHEELIKFLPKHSRQAETEDCMSHNWVTEALNSNTQEATRERKRLYRELVIAIALNDEPGELRLRTVAEMISVSLIADVFKKTPEQVAAAVIRVRRSENGERYEK
jgi:hypothetical protein